jgi:hypothetical protein
MVRIDVNSFLIGWKLILLLFPMFNINPTGVKTIATWFDDEVV